MDKYSGHIQKFLLFKGSSSWGLSPLKLLVIGQFYSSRHKFSPIEKALSPMRSVLDTPLLPAPQIIVPLLHYGKHFACSSLLWFLDFTTGQDYGLLFSPVSLHNTFCVTTGASPWGIDFQVRIADITLFLFIILTLFNVTNVICLIHRIKTFLKHISIVILKIYVMTQFKYSCTYFMCICMYGIRQQSNYLNDF